MATAAGAALLALALPPALSEARRSKAEHQVAKELRQRHLNPGRVDCELRSKPGCRWRARKGSKGWTYRCHGRATRGRRGWHLGRCHLHAPELAPLRRAHRPAAFGYNDLSLLLEHQLTLAPQAGADTLRFALYWQVVQPGKKKFQWSKYDAVYERLLELGIRPLFILLGAPCWATVSWEECLAHPQSIPPDDEHFDEFAHFAALAAERYPEAVGFEVWNEENTETFWHPGPEPARYARLLRMTRDEVKAADPSAKVISGGLYPVQQGRAGVQMRYRTFLGKVYKAEGTRIADAIGFHPYPGGKRSRHLREIRRLIARLRGTMAKHGDQARPVWITEVGLSTTGSSVQRYSEQAQADGLVTLYRTLRRIPGSPVLIIHTFFDLEGPSSDLWNGMGLIRADRTTRKPAFCALAAERTGGC